MGQELIATSGEETAHAHALVGSLYANLGRDDRSRRDILPAKIDADSRKKLQGYRQYLYGKLHPISMSMTDREKAKSALYLFFGNYLNIKADREGAANVYIQTLRDQPLFAIMRAIDDFVQGRVFDIGRDGERIPFTLEHAPSGPRLLDQVKKRAADVQEEKYKVNRLLAVTHFAEPEVSEAERERVAALMRQLANTMAVKSESIRVEEQRKVRDEAQQARDRAAEIIQSARRHNDEAYCASQVEQANG
jgi:hypothetical protein